VQTWLPYADLGKSAGCLDRQRLGKQRVECKQIIQALSGVRKGWARHPVTLMWEGHEGYLYVYAIIMTEEWISRGYEDSLLPWFYFYGSCVADDRFSPPSFIGDEEFHASHRKRLLSKNPNYYSKLGW
jgi:hypothetical protein